MRAATLEASFKLRRGWTAGEVEELAKAVGFTLTRVTGSHFIYHHPLSTRPLPIPRNSSKRQLNSLGDDLVVRIKKVYDMTNVSSPPPSPVQPSKVSFVKKDQKPCPQPGMIMPTPFKWWEEMRRIRRENRLNEGECAALLGISTHMLRSAEVGYQDYRPQPLFEPEFQKWCTLFQVDPETTQIPFRKGERPFNPNGRNTRPEPQTVVVVVEELQPVATDEPQTIQEPVESSILDECMVRLRKALEGMSDEYLMTVTSLLELQALHAKNGKK